MKNIMIISNHRRRKKKYWDEDYEYMFHLVSYKWFRRTQYITSIGLFYNVWEFYLEGVWLWRISGVYLEDVWLCEELSGEVNHTNQSVTDLFSFGSCHNTPYFGKVIFHKVYPQSVSKVGGQGYKSEILDTWSF